MRKLRRKFQLHPYFYLIMRLGRVELSYRRIAEIDAVCGTLLALHTEVENLSINTTCEEWSEDVPRFCDCLARLSQKVHAIRLRIRMPDPEPWEKRGLLGDAGARVLAERLLAGGTITALEIGSIDGLMRGGRQKRARRHGHQGNSRSAGS